MRNFLYRLMMGRYGSDRLNKHLLILSIVLTIANVFVKSVIIYVFVYILLLYVLFRMLSKNINKRYQENQRYEQKTRKSRQADSGLFVLTQGSGPHIRVWYKRAERKRFWISEI